VLDTLRREHRSTVSGASVTSALPVLLLSPAGRNADAPRTLAALARQSVHTVVLRAGESTDDVRGEFIALVLCGALPDVTACERAVWFLTTHPELTHVTGACGDQEGAEHATLRSLAQFVLVRTAALRTAIAADATLQLNDPLAVALALHRAAVRGAGWLSEPVIRRSTDAQTLAQALTSCAARQFLTLDATLLLDRQADAVPAHPLQRLEQVATPAVTVRQQPATGLRVLVLLQGFPMGGYTAFNADLLPRLTAAGHAITVCTTEIWRTDWRLDRVRAATPDIHHAHATVPAASVPAYIDWLVTSREVDAVLLSHSFLGLHLLPWLRARHPSVAFVDYVHTDWFEAGMYGSYAEMAVQWEGQLDAQLATSHALVSHLVSRGCAADAVCAAHIGIDTAHWQHTGPRLAVVRDSLGATRDTLLLLFSGRLSAEKRPHLAVDVLARLRGEGRDAMLVVAGGGPLLAATHARAAAAGVADRVKFLGELDEQTLQHVYAASDILLAPSEIEGISRSLYEAMAMGCVPVVSDVGGQRELVLAGTGSLVPAARDDATPYVDAVRPWFDAGARARAQAAARTHLVSQFDSACTVRTVEAALRLAMARRPGRQTRLPEAIAAQLAVSSLEITRRHVVRAAGR
jgi:glycosyltransferase involved in cell wall biosynthesis